MDSRTRTGNCSWVRRSSSAVFVSGVAFLMLVSAGAADNSWRAAQAAATDAASLPSFAAAPAQRYRCRVGWTLRKRQGSRICKRHGSIRAPKCGSGYRRRATSLGWRCERPAPIPAPLPQAPAPAPAPSPAPAPYTTPSPSPAPSNDAHQLDVNYSYAFELGRSFYGVRDYSGYWYNWGVDRSQCVMIGGTISRCWLWLWKQVETQDSDFYWAYTRYTFRMAVFTHDVGGNQFYSESNQAELFEPVGLICTDVITPPSSAPLCSPNGPWY